MRKLKSWLKGLSSYVENTEAAREFWHWAGVSTIASALQRKVWLPFGIERYFPNQYILIVGPPATRKGGPVGLSKNLLQAIQIPVAVDSSSKRKFTMELAEVGKSEFFSYKSKNYAQCSLSVISKELSSLLAVNPKEMVEVLTDLYDSHDTWDYSTRGQDEDKLNNVCVNFLAATTPVSLAAILPQEAIGGGFTSRCLIVYASDVYQRISRPTITPKQQELYKVLLHDLHHISQLVGEFSWTPAAEKVFDEWYYTIDKRLKHIQDEKVQPFLGRIHAVVLKTAMAYRVDHTDELILDEPEIQTAIDAVERTLQSAGQAFGAHGVSRTGPETHKIIHQLRILGEVTFRELLRHNYRNTNKSELQEIISSIEAMGLCKTTYDTNTGQLHIKWIKKAVAKEQNDL